VVSGLGSAGHIVAIVFGILLAIDLIEMFTNLGLYLGLKNRNTGTLSCLNCFMITFIFADFIVIIVGIIVSIGGSDGALALL